MLNPRVMSSCAASFCYLSSSFPLHKRQLSVLLTVSTAKVTNLIASDSAAAGKAGGNILGRQSIRLSWLFTALNRRKDGLGSRY